MNLTNANPIATPAFGGLIEQHYRVCLSVANSILHDLADAQDAVQEASLTALKHRDQYRGEAPFHYWLLRIVVNQCLMFLRSRKRSRLVSLQVDTEKDGTRALQLTAPGADPERLTLDQEQRVIFEREIGRLPLHFKAVLLLRDMNQLSMKNLADRLGITVGAAKSRLFRARIELRERVVSHYGGSDRPIHQLEPNGGSEHAIQWCRRQSSTSIDKLMHLRGVPKTAKMSALNRAAERIS